MGVVRKQSIYSLISIYFGFAIGALNTYFFNLYLTQEEYGLTSVFKEVYFLFASFASLGSLITFYRFSPFYNFYLDREKNDFPAIILSACLIGLGIILGIIWLFKPLIVEHFSANSPKLVEYYFLLIPLTVSFLATMMFETFAHMLKRTIQFNFLKEVVFRVWQSFAIILYYFKLIDIDQFFLLYALMFIPSAFFMALIVFTNNGIKFNFKVSSLTKRLKGIALKYTAFHFSGVMIGVLPTAVNSLLISSISNNGLSDAAVYLLAKFFISVMDAPLRSMSGINTALLSESFMQKDYNKIGSIYKKTSINLLVIGTAIFFLIFSNIDIVTFIFPDKDYSKLGIVFALFGTAKLVELSMGMNGTILFLSKFWKTDFYISAIVILSSIPLNYFLIKTQPLLGAAIGEALMLCILGLTRYYWVNKLLHLTPFTKNTLKVVLIGIVCLGIAYFVPDIKGLELIMMFVRSSLFMALYILGLLIFKPSSDIQDLIQSLLKKKK